MSQQNWRDILKEMNLHNEKVQHNDSLELGDSWRDMPRKVEGVANKTNGLYRRSAVPDQAARNIYRLVLEKKTDHAEEKPASDAKAAPEVVIAPQQSHKDLIPSVQPIASDGSDESDSLNFSEFLMVKDNAHKAITSTPYPVRQIDANKSPKRGTGNVHRIVADSPRNLFVPAPTRIPISTPRSSRISSDSVRNASKKPRVNSNRAPSPVVSSTVNHLDDDDDPVQLDPGPQPPPILLAGQNGRKQPAQENAEQNFVKTKDDQLEQDAGAKALDEALFRRPQSFPSLSRKLNLDPDNDTVAEQQPNLITQSGNNSKRSKKSNTIKNPIMERYLKVGEDVTNRTNGVSLESSSSLARRRLYRKGDSCNEDGLVQGMEEEIQKKLNGTFSISRPTSVQPNAADNGKRLATSERQPILSPAVTTTANAATLPESKQLQQNDIESITPPVSLSNNVQVNLADELNDRQSQQHNGSDENQHQSDSDHPKSNSVGKSKDNSNRQIHISILRDWSGTSEELKDDESGDGEDGVNCESDKLAEDPISKVDNQSPAKASKVRHLRSRNNETGDTISSRSSRNVHAHVSNAHQIKEGQGSDQDGHCTNNETEKLQKGNGSKKAKTESVRATQQRQVFYCEHRDSEENEPADEGQPSTRRTRNQLIKRDKTKSRQGNNKKPTESQAKSPEECEIDQGNAVETNENKRPKNSQPKGSKKRLDVDDVEQQANPHEAEWSKRSQEDVAIESVNDVDEGSTVNAELRKPGRREPKQPAKSLPKATRKRKEENAIETDRCGDVETSTTSRRKRNRIGVDVEQGVNAAEEIETEQTAESQTKKRTNHRNDDAKKTNRPTRQKRSTVGADARDSNCVDNHIVGDDNISEQLRADDTDANLESKSNRQSRKRKRPNESALDVQEGDVALTKKRKKTSKWYSASRTTYYNPTNSRAGTRHSSRERRCPSTNLLIPEIAAGWLSSSRAPKSSRSTSRAPSSSRSTFKAPTSSRSTLKAPTSSRSTLRDSADSLSPPQRTEGESVFSMLIDGSIDKEPPLITRLNGIEISQGFHKTVKNDLVIRHIPGETGPSYGYFTLEPGMVKRACRISWNLHIHVVSGTIQIMSGDECETMVTGSFASLQSGTKYSLRNDTQNPTLIFFNQHSPKN